MKRIGLTGGIGMGKSTCLHWLTDQGVRVVDTDHLSRDLTGRNSSLLPELRALFGDNVFSPSGDLNRRELGNVVFADKSKLDALQDLLHPRIRRLWMDRLARWDTEDCPAAVVEIPLLFETGAETEFDVIVCVACGSRTQQARLHHRGWDDLQIHQRNASQLPVREKMARSDHVIWTEGACAATEEQLKMVLSRVGVMG